jgi:hypothetical protein
MEKEALKRTVGKISARLFHDKSNTNNNNNPLYRPTARQRLYKHFPAERDQYEILSRNLTIRTNIVT